MITERNDCNCVLVIGARQIHPRAQFELKKRSNAPGAQAPRNSHHPLSDCAINFLRIQLVILAQANWSKSRVVGVGAYGFIDILPTCANGLILIGLRQEKTVANLELR